MISGATPRTDGALVLSRPGFLKWILDEQAGLDVGFSRDLVFVAAEFLAPRRPHRVIGGEFDDPLQLCVDHMSASDVTAAIERLQTAGVLTQAHVDDAPDALRTANAICVTLDGVRGGIAALGADGVGFEPVLSSLLEQLEDAGRRVAAAVDAAVVRRLGELGITPLSRGLRLNFGAGHRGTDGWITVGFPPSDVAIDLRNPLPFPDGSVAYAYACNLLEHLRYKAEVLPFLREVQRILQPGGRIRVVVPDIGAHCVQYANGNSDFFDAFYETHAPEYALVRAFLPVRTALATTLDYAGAAFRHRLDMPFQHKSGYDFETLSELLAEAGFVRVERSAYMMSSHRALDLDAQSLDAGAVLAGVPDEMFVEAVSPG